MRHMCTLAPRLPSALAAGLMHQGARTQGLLTGFACDPVRRDWLVTTSARGRVGVWDLRFQACPAPGSGLRLQLGDQGAWGVREASRHARALCSRTRLPGMPGLGNPRV